MFVFTINVYKSPVYRLWKLSEQKSEGNKVGDDKDAHGCIASAGYT